MGMAAYGGAPFLGPALREQGHLDMQSLPQVRERGQMRQTAVINQIGGLLFDVAPLYPKGGVICRRLYRDSERHQSAALDLQSTADAT